MMVMAIIQFSSMRTLNFESTGDLPTVNDGGIDSANPQLNSGNDAMINTLVTTLHRLVLVKPCIFNLTYLIFHLPHMPHRFHYF